MIRPAADRPRIAVVGGGISGLTTAYRLERLTAGTGVAPSIDLYEGADRLGGKIRTDRIDGMAVEVGAESFLSRKPAGVALCRELGLGGDLRGTRPENRKTFVWRDGGLHRLPEGMTGFVPGRLGALRSTTLLSARGKARIGLDLVLPASKSTGDESLARFMERRLGSEAYRRMIQPLLCGIYCADGSDLSLAATYPQLRELERKHGSLLRGLRAQSAAADSDRSGPEQPPFVTLPGGMSDLTDRLEQSLTSTTVHSGTPVVAAGLGVEHRLTTADGRTEGYDAVIFTTSAAVTARIVADEHPELGARLASIPHVSTATVNLWFDRSRFGPPPDGYGFVIPADQQRAVTAVTWSSSKHFDRVPDDRVLIRAYLGRAGHEFDPATPDDAVVGAVRTELDRTMGVTAEPDGFLVGRWPESSPQYTIGHLDRLAAIDAELTELSSVFVTGSSYRGVGIPDCIAQADATARRVATAIGASTPASTG